MSDFGKAHVEVSRGVFVDLPLFPHPAKSGRLVCYYQDGPGSPVREVYETDEPADPQAVAEAAEVRRDAQEGA